MNPLHSRKARHVRNSRREEPRHPPQPTQQAGQFQSQTAPGISWPAPSLCEGQKRHSALNAGKNTPASLKGKGKAQATEAELMEQEHVERSEQLRELLQWLDEADIDPSLTDFMETDEIAQV